jgi:hypothetical protein
LVSFVPNLFFFAHCSLESLYLCMLSCV